MPSLEDLNIRSEWVGHEFRVLARSYDWLVKKAGVETLFANRKGVLTYLQYQFTPVSLLLRSQPDMLLRGNEGIEIFEAKAVEDAWDNVALEAWQPYIQGKPTHPCSICRSTNWWWPPNTHWGPKQWICGRCHPNPNEEAEMPTDKGHCKHGEFNLAEGCPQCIAERQAREAAKAEGTVAEDEESLAENQQGQLELATDEISPQEEPAPELIGTQLAEEAGIVEAKKVIGSQNSQAGQVKRRGGQSSAGRCRVFECALGRVGGGGRV